MATAEEGKEQFTSDELKNIRQVSQAILVARGQQRSAAMAESQQVREDIEKFKSLLREEQYRLEVPQEGVINLTGDSVISISVAQISDKAEENALMQKARRQLKKWFGEAEADQQHRSVRLRQAREILTARRSKIEKEMPSAWELWKEQDPRKAAIRDRFKSLEKELTEIEELDADQRREHVKKMLLRMEPPADKSEPEPTISSITKHIKK